MWELVNRETSKQPLYQQVIALIEQLIESGLLHAEQRLPSERQLAELLAVNRSTIIHALEELTDRGILIRKIGSGTFVNNAKWGLQCYPLINWQPMTSSLLSAKQDSYTLKVHQLRKKKPHDMCDLANGDLPSDLFPTLTVPEFSWQNLVHQEQTSEASHLGLGIFKKSVREYLYRHLKLKVKEDEILITSGAQQAIFLITQGLLKPGDAIGIEAPSYFYSLPIFQAAGLRIYAIPMDREGIRLDGLDVLLKKHSLKMIFLNPVFQNPTGLVMSQQRKRVLLDFCYLKRIPIVEDDAYSALYFNKQLDVSPLKKLDTHQQVIYIGSLSKYIGKNIRAGWMIAPKGIVRKLADIRLQLDAGLSVLPQLLAQHYLDHHSNQHQAFLRIMLTERANKLMMWLEDNYSKSLQFSKPLGGYHLYTKCYFKSKEIVDALLTDLLQKHIIVARGTDFGDTNEYLRFSFGHFYTP